MRTATKVVERLQLTAAAHARRAHAGGHDVYGEEHLLQELVAFMLEKGVPEEVCADQARRLTRANYELYPEADEDKEQEGDQKTPEGLYMLDARNPDSDYFLSIRISYPDARDRADARAQGVDPGGQIMIHGQPNVPTFSQAYYAREDWTNGCIAVSNSDMIDIWLMTPDRVPIEIVP